MKKNVIIVGAGLAGSLCALYMLKRGYNVSVYERRPDMRKTTLIAGRSINLALSKRGWTALEQVGVADKVKEGEVVKVKVLEIDKQGRIKLTMKGLD